MLRPAHSILLAGATFVALVPPCHAAPLPITPTLELSQEEALARTAATEKADTLIAGNGDRLRIRYTSPVRIDADLAPLRRGSGFDPTEILHFTLPSGENMEAIVDLTVSPGWRPFEHPWHLFLASPRSTGSIDINGMEFLPWTWGSLLRTMTGNLASREVYQVSTFHALRGYRILGGSLATVLGVLVLSVALLYAGLRNLRGMLTVLVAGSMIYSVWFGVDLARFTRTNLSEWWREGLYNKAGAAAAVAKAIRREADASPIPLLVYVCHDTTDFYAKVLRSMVYPIPVSVNEKDVPRATHIVVAGKIAWSFDQGVLTCGSAAGPARELAEFRDGAVLYASVAP